MDLISVIIPYYKKKDSILKTVNSVLNQTYQNFEIIIIYDDECENDLNLIKKIKDKDNRIFIIQNKKKMGAGNSRNIGISNSKGGFVAFIDADYLWKNDKLSKQINFMKFNNYEASHTSYSIINEYHKVIGNRVARNFLELKDLLKSCDIGTSTVMIKKDLISNDTKFASLKTKEDFVLWLKFLKRGTKIYGLNEVLTLWCKSSSSLSSSTIQKLIDGFRVYYRHMNFSYFKSLYYLLCLSLNFLLKK